MKKKLSILLASVMLLGSAYGIVGCGGDTPPDTPDTPGGGGGNGPQTETEQFLDIKTGVNDFVNYNGSITVENNFTIMMDGTEIGGIVVQETSQKMSFDSETKRAYVVNKSEMKMYAPGTDLESEDATPLFTSEGTERIKIFEKDGDWYQSRYNPSQGVASCYDKVNKDTAYAVLRNENYEVSPMFSQLAVSDYATMKSAYEEVYAEQLQKEKTVTALATATANVSVAEENGKSALTIATETFTIRNEQHIENDMVMKFYEKDGKLTGMYGAQECYSHTEDLSAYSKQSVVSTMEITYAFDEEGHSAIENGFYTNVDYSNNIAMQIELEAEGVTIGGGLNKVHKNEEAESWFSSYDNWYSFYGEIDVAWYTDEARTQPFEIEGKTVSDIQNIKKVYGVVTPKEGTAVVVQKSFIEDIRTDKYKNIIDTAGSYQGFGTSFMPYNDNATFTYEEGVDEIRVNNVKQDSDASSFVVEAGNIYKVEYVNYLQDSDEDIFVLMD